MSKGRQPPGVPAANGSAAERAIHAGDDPGAGLSLGRIAGRDACTGLRAPWRAGSRRRSRQPGEVAASEASATRLLSPLAGEGSCTGSAASVSFASVFPAFRMGVSVPTAHDARQQLRRARATFGDHEVVDRGEAT